MLYIRFSCKRVSKCGSCTGKIYGHRPSVDDGWVILCSHTLSSSIPHTNTPHISYTVFFTVCVATCSWITDPPTCLPFNNFSRPTVSHSTHIVTGQVKANATETETCVEVSVSYLSRYTPTSETLSKLTQISCYAAHKWLRPQGVFIVQS